MGGFMEVRKGRHSSNTALTEARMPKKPNRRAAVDARAAVANMPIE
jgi:hypothetical protein